MLKNSKLSSFGIVIENQHAPWVPAGEIMSIIVKTEYKKVTIDEQKVCSNIWSRTNEFVSIFICLTSYGWCTRDYIEC